MTKVRDSTANESTAGSAGTGWTPALSGFLDLVQLADHPGDRLAYRHFQMTPLCAAKYPGGIPEAVAVSSEFAKSFATLGMVRTFCELRALFPEDPAKTWSQFTEARFSAMLRAAEKFESSRGPGTRLADFLKFLQSNQNASCDIMKKV